MDDWNARWQMSQCRDCDIAEDRKDPVSAYGIGTPFSATYEGERYRFYAAEHHNLGPGWSCLEIDGRLPSRVYSSGSLSDVQPTEPANLPERFLALYGSRLKARQSTTPQS